MSTIGSIIAAVFAILGFVIFLAILPASALTGSPQIVADVTFSVSGNYNGLFSCYSSLTTTASASNYHQQTVLHLNSFMDSFSAYDFFPTTHVITIGINGYGSQTVNFVSTILGATFSGSATFHNIPASQTYGVTITLDNGGCLLSGISNPSSITIKV